MTDECVVCLGEFAGGECIKTTCGHMFHDECLSQWLKKSFSCPICRKSFTESDQEEEGGEGEAGDLSD